MKRRRFLPLLAIAFLSLATLSACISDEGRGWAGPVVSDETQVVSTSRGRLDGLNIAADGAPAWSGTLSVPLSDRDTRILSTNLSPSDTPYQGDLLRIGSEIVRVRSLTVNGAEREMHLDRGYAGTTASAHPVNTPIVAERRHWRFPDDWHIRQGSARRLTGIYGPPIIDSTGVMYLGDYGGWVYAFEPDAFNLDAATDNDKPKTAVADLGEHVFGGIALDEAAGRLYATSGDRLFMLSTDRLRASLAAGGGQIEPETSFFFQAAEDIWAAPVAEDGVVYVAALDGSLSALDAATGAVRWSYDAGRGLATKPLLAGDLVLAGGFGNFLVAVDRATGALRWQYDVANWILATPVIDGDTAYFGDFDGILHAVDVETGAARWTRNLERGKIRAAVAITDDFIVAGTESGWLISLDRDDQQLVWEVKVDSNILADLVVAGDEVLIAPQGCVTLPGGQVKTYYRAVDPATGTLRRAEGVC